MSKKKKNKKESKNIIIKIISVLLIICGVISFAAAVFLLIYGINVKGTVDCRMIAFFSVAAILLLIMGISEIIALKKNERNLTGLITGLVTLFALIIFMIVGITELFSSGIEFSYILVVMFSPAMIVTILYIKALMKDFGQM